MIKVENLVKRFGARPAVSGVSFEVQKGEVLGFLGPNGAGKTTTMRMITGFLPPTSGRSIVNGFDVAEKPIEARRAIGYLPENAPVYFDMTVEEFLRFIAEMRGFEGKVKQERVEGALDKCLLKPVRHQTIETLSKGYRQRTCFAQAILHDPPALILDEPTEGLDPNQKHVVRDMILQMGREKVIILSTHILEEVEAICSRVIIISAGAVVADDTPAALKRRSRSFNAVTLRVNAPAKETAAALREVPKVARVETLGEADGTASLRILPERGAPVLDGVLACARAKQWTVTDVQTDDGRLDDVFRTLTTTADVGESAKA